MICHVPVCRLQGTIGRIKTRAFDSERCSLNVRCAPNAQNYGWMSSAGHNSPTHLTMYPDRYRLLHLRDFKRPSKASFAVLPGESPGSTELGRGNIDYKPIFSFGRKGFHRVLLRRVISPHTVSCAGLAQQEKVMFRSAS